MTLHMILLGLGAWALGAIHFRTSRPLRVYLVEYSPLVRERLQEAIEQDGEKVVGHADAAATAITEIAALLPDAVVVDIALREGTGLHVLKEIGEIPEKDRPARVVLTNFSREWYRASAKRLGADYFFDKSREIPEMLDVLRSMIPSRHREPTPAG